HLNRASIPPAVLASSGIRFALQCQLAATQFFSGLLDAYLAARTSLKEKTVKDYRDGVERHLKPWLDLRLADISGEMVEMRHRSLQESIAAGGRYSGKAVANNIFKTLGSLWTFVAERESSLPPNPTRRLRRQWFKVFRRESLVKADDLPQFYRAV